MAQASEEEMKGGIEVEVLTEGQESAGKWRGCKKNPGHKGFIQASHFSVDHLPDPYKTKLCYRGIRALSRLTVKLTVKATSKGRPDDDCAARIRGTRFPRIGTGLVHEFWYDKKFSDLKYDDQLDEEEDKGGYGYFYATSEAADKDMNVEQCLESIKSLREELSDDELDLEWSSIEDDDVWDEDVDEEAGSSTKNRWHQYLRGTAPFDDVRCLNASSGARVLIDDDDDDDDYDDIFDGMDDNENSSMYMRKLLGLTPGGTAKEPNFSLPFHTIKGISHQPKVPFPDFDQDEDEIVNDTYRFVRPCPCPECAVSNEPKPEGYYMNVLTARHVVFDDDEAKATVVDLFYDDETAAGVKKMYGIHTFAYSPYGDWCLLMCATHDRELVNKLQITMKPMLKLIDRMKNRSSSPLAVICSHPHGYVKQITFGEWVVRKVPSTRRQKIIKTSYLYETPTCPGSSGAAVLILGHRKGTRFLDSSFHPHHGSHISGALNMSGRFQSHDREFKDAPSSLVEDLLHEYEELCEKNQRAKAGREQAIETTEKFQFYIQHLREKVKNKVKRLEILKGREDKNGKRKQAEGGRK